MTLHRQWFNLRRLCRGRRVCPYALVPMLALIWGCTPNRPAPAGRAYFGPTDPISTVVARINANNQPIRSLFAFHTFEATIYDQQGKGTFVNGRGTLNFRKPGELLLQGKNNLQAPWLGIAAFLSVAVLLSLLIFIGEAVRDAFDPNKAV